MASTKAVISRFQRARKPRYQRMRACASVTFTPSRRMASRQREHEQSWRMRMSNQNPSTSNISSSSRTCSRRKSLYGLFTHSGR
jgi:hypothetical protein